MIGLFEIYYRLYGVSIVDKTAETPRWHDDVRFYQLFDEKQDHDWWLYFDLYARQGKRGGAWMSGFQARYQNVQQQYQQLPVCFMVANFTPALNGKPSLLTQHG